MTAATQRAPKVGRIVTYYRATSRKPVTAKVTTTAGSVVTLIVSSSRQSFAAVAKRTAHSQTGVWDWR
jgi:hypothetical protein